MTRAASLLLTLNHRSLTFPSETYQRCQSADRYGLYPCNHDAQRIRFAVRLSAAHSPERSKKRLCEGCRLNEDDTVVQTGLIEVISGQHIEAPLLELGSSLPTIGYCSVLKTYGHGHGHCSQEGPGGYEGHNSGS